MRARTGDKHQAIVIGASLGGEEALHVLLSALPADFPLPIIIVRHLFRTSDNIYFIKKFKEDCQLDVREAEEKEAVEKGCVYVAPAGYHLLIEEDRTFSLSVDDLVNYSRPSIDVLFESAAEVYASGLTGIILTGINSDGAAGLKKVKEWGGLAIVQEPDTAVGRAMPEFAIQVCKVDHILPLHEMSKLLIKIVA